MQLEEGAGNNSGIVIRKCGLPQAAGHSIKVLQGHGVDELTFESWRYGNCGLIFAAGTFRSAVAAAGI